MTTLDTLTRDHVLVIQAARARLSDQPEFANQLLATCHDPLVAAVDLVGLLIKDRATRDGGAES